MGKVHTCENLISQILNFVERGVESEWLFGPSHRRCYSPAFADAKTGTDGRDLPQVTQGI